MLIDNGTFENMSSAHWIQFDSNLQYDFIPLLFYGFKLVYFDKPKIPKQQLCE